MTDLRTSKGRELLAEAMRAAFSVLLIADASTLKAAAAAAQRLTPINSDARLHQMKPALKSMIAEVVELRRLARQDAAATKRVARKSA